MKITHMFTYMLLSTLLFACSNNHNFGVEIPTKNPVTVENGWSQFANQNIKEHVLKGKIGAVCQTEGCWFKFESDSGELFVDFDHKFKIPMNSSGKTAVVWGDFSRDTTSVELLKEYAKDDGKSETEIAAITEPEIRVIFNAKGLRLE